MSLKKALLAATVLSLPVAAQAQPVNGLYVGAGAGVNWLNNQSTTFPTNPTGINRAGLDTDVGFVGVASIGWGFGNGIRAEAEFNYRTNDLDRVTLNGASVPNGGGRIQQYGFMGNAFFDIPLGGDMMGVTVAPYVGAGLGYVITDVSANGRGTLGTLNANGDDGGFAYQFIAGIGFGLNFITPGLTLTTEYRYMATIEPEQNAQLRNTAGQVVARGTTGDDGVNHSVLVGLRYAFGAAPAAVAAAPAAAPAPARTFLVFFDWDRADLTDRARQIIAEAANNARTLRTTRIEVSGHADRTGSAAYNQRLSVRRAEAVAAELVRRGINRNEITIQGFGFDRPLVPTAMGVREPQNRRVEIVLR